MIRVTKEISNHAQTVFQLAKSIDCPNQKDKDMVKKINFFHTFFFYFFFYFNLFF